MNAEVARSRPPGSWPRRAHKTSRTQTTRGDYRALRAHRPPESWRRALEIGCGDALFFERLEVATTVEGIEPDASLLTDARRRRGTIFEAAFDRIFTPPEPYSLIVVLDVLERLKDPIGALRRAVQSLEPTRTIVTVPACMGLWSRHDERLHHYTKPL